MKTGKFICLILVEVILMFLLFCPVFVNKRSHVQAFSAWWRNPTSETEAKWEYEKRKLNHEMMVVDLSLLAALALNTAWIVIILKNKRRSPIGSPGTDPIGQPRVPHH
jgi:uncharacterized membrane protein (UPF0182 family)